MLATQGARPQLLWGDRPLPLPAASGTSKLEWQWSFSNDLNWLAVRRSYPGRKFDCDNPLPSGNDEWTGLINLREWSAISTPLSPLLGWRGSKPITTAELPPWHSALALSEDGTLAVLFDGRDGNIVVTLRNLETDQSRVLYQLPTPHPASYAERGGVVSAAFSPAGDQLALLELLRLDDDRYWHVEVRVVSLDAEREFYSDRFCVEYNGPIPQLSFAPSGGPLLAYWRRVQGRTSLIVATFLAATQSYTACEIPADLYSNLLYTFPLLWSPGGDRLAWVEPSRAIKAVPLHTGQPEFVGRLDLEARFWSWACPRVISPG